MAAEIYQVGCFRIDPAKRELWRGEQLIELTPQVFDCLTYLLLNRARAVGRDELMAAIWGKTDVTETLLGQTIMYARRAVGDAGDTQSVIRTIPRFGYRWVADVVEIPDEATLSRPVPPSEAAMPSEAVRAISPDSLRCVDRSAEPRKVYRSGGMLVTACAGLLLAVFVIAALWHRPEAGATAEGVSAPGVRANKNAVLAVVLPVDVAESPETAWVRLGVMDSLISRLREGGQPTVPSQTVVTLLETAVSDTDPLLTIEREIGPGLVIRPQAEQVGEGWVVTLGLTGQGSWPETIDGKGASVLAAADAAADRLLAEALGGKGAVAVSVGSPPEALTKLLQQSKAALLAGDQEAAGLLLESAPTALKDHPEVRFLAVQVDYRSGRIEAAQTALASLLLELPKNTQPVLRGHALLVSGSLDRQYGRYTDAERAYRDAIELLDPVEQPILLGNANAYLALALMGQQRFDEAATALARSRVLLEGTGNVLGVAEVEANFGLLYAERGQLAAAVPRLADAVDRYRRLGVLEEAMAIQIGLANAYSGLLDHTNAVANSREAWVRANKPASRLRTWAGVVHASALSDSGMLREADRLIGMLERETEGNATLIATFALMARAQLAQQTGDWARVERVAATAHERFGMDMERGLAKFRGSAWLIWLRALRVQGKQIEARSQMAAMREWEERQDDDYARFYVALADAEHKWFDNDHGAAESRYQEALRFAEEVAVPAMVVMVAESYGRALISDGALQQATDVIGRVAAWADRDFECALLQVRLHRALGQTDAWRQALNNARRLAGERTIPAELVLPDRSS